MTIRTPRWPMRLATALLLALGLGAAVPDDKTGEKTGGKAGDARAVGPQVVVLDIKGPIGPAVSDYVVRGLQKAHERGATLVVLRMDTPGGLDTSMREIIQAILASPVPVASFVPSGGRAASAGTYILYASHVAAMAPGANLGAATPVQIGGSPGGRDDDRDRKSPFDRLFEKEKERTQEKEREKQETAREGAAKKNGAAQDDRGKSAPADDSRSRGPAGKAGMEEKVLNDAVAYIRSLAQMRGRNVEWAEKAVREAASLSAEDAARLNVIDVVARGVDDLLAKIDGRTINVAGRDRTLETKDVPVVVLAPDWRSELLGIITNPNVAYLLLLVGIYGLIFEAYSPGLAGPGIVGVISLLLGLYALHLLPVSYAGLALTILGLALMTAEAFVPSFGVLGIGGIAAFVIGSILLIDTDAPGFGISWLTIGAFTATSALFFMLVLAYLARSRKRAVVSGIEEMIGAVGRIVDWDDGKGRVWIHGEMWSARGAQDLSPGGAARVRRVDGLTLEVDDATAGPNPTNRRQSA